MNVSREIDPTSFTTPSSPTGSLAATVRCGTSPEGLPIGVHVVRPWRDDVALAAALRLERELGGWRAPAFFRPRARGYAGAVSPTSVRIVLSDRDGRVLMLQRAADDDILPGAWELPGGGIDPGETPVQAGARELREEVGVAVDEADLADWGTFRRAGGRCTAFFAVDCVAGDCAPELSHEHDDWRWAEGAWELEPLTPSARWAVARHRWPDRDPR